MAKKKQWITEAHQYIEVDVPDGLTQPVEKESTLEKSLQGEPASRVATLMAMDLAHVASRQDNEEKSKDIMRAMNGQKEKGHQDEKINRREISLINTTVKNITGEDVRPLLGALAHSHDEQLVHSVNEKKGFPYRSMIQLAGAIKESGIEPSESNIRYLIESGATSLHGIFKPEVSARKYFGDTSEYSNIVTVNLAETLADMINKGAAVDSEAVKLGGSLKNNEQASHAMRALLNDKALKAMRENERYSLALPHIIASVMDLPADQLVDAIKRWGPEAKIINEDTLARLTANLNGLSGKDKLEYDPYVANIMSDPTIQILGDGKAHPEDAAIVERTLAFYGLNQPGVVGELQKLGPQYRTPWTTIQMKKNKDGVSAKRVVAQEAMPALIHLYNQADGLRDSFGDESSKGDAEARTNVALAAIRAARLGAAGRVINEAAQKGEAKMTSAQSEAETGLIESIHSALGRSPEFLGKPGRLMKKPTGAYAEYAARQDVSKKGPYQQEINNPSRGPMYRSMEAAILTAQEYSAMTKMPLDQAMTNIILSMGDVFGFPIDDKFGPKKLEALVGKMMEFRKANKEALAKNDGFGLITADLDFATGKTNEIDLGYATGTLALLEAAAQAKYGVQARQSLAAGYRTIDNKAMDEGAVLLQAFPSLIAHGFKKVGPHGFGVDIPAEDAHAIAVDVLRNVEKRDQAIQSVFMEMLHSSREEADMTKAKYSNVVDPRFPEGLPYEVVNTCAVLEPMRHAIGDDKQVDPEEVFMLTRLFPKVGARGEIVNVLSGITDVSTGQTHRDTAQGAIANYDRSLRAIYDVTQSGQYQRLNRALQFAKLK